MAGASGNNNGNSGSPVPGEIVDVPTPFAAAGGVTPTHLTQVSSAVMAALGGDNRPFDNAVRATGVAVAPEPGPAPLG